MTSVRVLAALSVLTMGASLTALASTPAEAAPTRGRVAVSQVAASAEAAPRGTQVTTSFALTNTRVKATRTRRVALYLVDAAGHQALLGGLYVSSIAHGATRTFSATRHVGAGFLAGDYRVKVCFPAVARGTCSSTPAVSVTITPATLTLSDDIVFVPLGDGEGSRPGVRVRVTNTGQAATGALTVALTAQLPGQPSSGPSGDYEVDDTTCGASLAPGRTCRVDVRRTAEGSATNEGVLTVSGVRSAAASATLVAPAHVEPGSYDFGDVAIGDSALHTFDLVNDSAESVDVRGGYLHPDDFSYDIFGDSPFTCAGPDYSPVPLAPGESCTFTVRFSPQSTGDKLTGGGVVTSAGDVPFVVAGTGLPGETQPGRPATRADHWS